MSLKEEPSRTVFYLETTGDEKADLNTLKALGYNHPYDSIYRSANTQYKKNRILYIRRGICYPQLMTPEDFGKCFKRIDWNLVCVNAGLIFIGAL